jgi:DNA repair protein RecO (recombination protein O)
MERFVTKAIVLGSVDYGEADRVVTLLTEDRGRLSAFAIAARKSRKRFGGALEIFTLVRASLVERRGDTVRFDEAHILEPFLNLRADLGGIARASHACELARELCRDHQAHPELFGELVDLLFRLSRGGGTPEDLLAFELSALSWAGLRPALDACAACGEAVEAALAFDPGRGGLLCRTCSPTIRGARPASPAVGTALRALQGGSREGLPVPVRREARGHLDAFLLQHLGRSLRSGEFMRSVGIE